MKNIDTLTDEGLVRLIKMLADQNILKELRGTHDEIHAEIIRTVLNELYCYAPVDTTNTIN